MARPQPTEIYPVMIDGIKFPSIIKVAQATGNSAAAYVPKEWMGKHILCILMDE
jgi:hypothetical protein